MSAKVMILNKIQEVTANTGSLDDFAASRIGSNLILAGALLVYGPVVAGIFGICAAEAVVQKIKGN